MKTFFSRSSKRSGFPDTHFSFSNLVIYRLTFSLNIMKQLLSVTNLTAISPKEFHTTYRLERSSNDGMDIDQEASEVEEELDESTSGFSTIRSRNRNRDLTVALRFDQPGGKLVGYSVSTWFDISLLIEVLKSSKNKEN